MSTKHQPDREMQFMLRVLRELLEYPIAGRKRVLSYWLSRAEDMPENTGKHGAQQLDLEADASTRAAA